MADDGERYDAELERFDVAVRAIWRLARAGQKQHWECLAELGLVDRERLEAFYDVGRPGTEKQVFELLKAHPPIFYAALELLRRYQEVTASDRWFYYKRWPELLTAWASRESR